MDDQRDNATLSRRRFLGAAAGTAAAGAALATASPAAAQRGRRRGNANEAYGFGRPGDIPLDRIGIQLFTVRDLLADNELDLSGTFEVLSDAGYAFVEVGGNYERTNALLFTINVFSREDNGFSKPY